MSDQDKRWWDILAVGCPRNVDAFDWRGSLLPVLARLDPDDIVLFDRWFDERTDEAYREDLWSAAELINGGASDDGFYYFRCWLVGRGKRAFESALRDPDTLADFVAPGEICESEIYAISSHAWAEATGKSVDDYYDQPALQAKPMSRDLVKVEWPNSAEELQRRMPRLWLLATAAEANTADQD